MVKLLRERNDKQKPKPTLVNATSDRQALAAMLEWHIAMGVDECIGEAPVNWLEAAWPRETNPVAVAPRRQTPPRPVMATGYRPSNADETEQSAIGEARQLAAGADSLEALMTALAGFKGCPLSRTATNLCVNDGNPEAHVLLVGEAPGRDEDLQGKPFVGRSGQLLDKMLRQIGLSRTSDKPHESVHISNTVFWRPPGNRKPTEAETLMCLPFLKRLIELTNPKLIVCLGGTPTQRLVGTTTGILKARGKWYAYEGANGSTDLLATLHPSYLLRQPAQKKLAWMDFLALRTKLNQQENQ